MAGLQLSLQATERCRPTGGRLVCVGHWDYYGQYMIWTRHLLGGLVKYRVVPYDHCAPEVIADVVYN